MKTISQSNVAVMSSDLSEPSSLGYKSNSPNHNRDSSVADSESLSSFNYYPITEHSSNYKNHYNREEIRSLLVKLYQTLGYDTEANKLQACCQKFYVETCGAHSQAVYPTQRCYVPLCLNCAFYRQKRAFKRLFPKIREFIRTHKNDLPVLITLTVKNSNQQLIDIHRDFKVAFKKLRRLKRWKYHIRGGIVSFELTVSVAREWHYHAHIFAFRKSRDRYEQTDLCADWEKSNSGAGYIADIRAVKNLENGFREVLNYSFKPIDLMKSRFDAPRLAQFYKLSKRARLAESFGDFYGFDLVREPRQADEFKPRIPRCCQECGTVKFGTFLTRRELADLRDETRNDAAPDL